MKQFIAGLVVLAHVTLFNLPAHARIDEVPGGRVAYMVQARAERERQHRIEVRQARREAAREAAALEQEQEEASTVAAPVVGSGSSSGGYLSAEQVGSYARAAGFPEEVVPIMVDIAVNHESGGCPTAVNGLIGCPSYADAAALLASSINHACGLWQIYPCYGGAALLNPAANAAAAYEKYQSGGLGHWGR